VRRKLGDDVVRTVHGIGYALGLDRTDAGVPPGGPDPAGGLDAAGTAGLPLGDDTDRSQRTDRVERP
jgi:hypothetical protein